MKLLTIGNPKTTKSRAYGYHTAVLHLAPHKLSGRNLCAHSTEGCRDMCLGVVSGRAAISKGNATFNVNGFTLPDNAIQRARLERSRLLRECPSEFLTTLKVEIGKERLRARKEGLRLAVRLNGTSDLPWENLAPELFTMFPDVQWYDYTKDAKRYHRALLGKLPPNYDLTFSRSETNGAQCLSFLRRGGRVAVVEDQTLTLPRAFSRGAKSARWTFSTRASSSMSSSGTWVTVEETDGDRHDLRFLDPAGVVVLSPKGKAHKDMSGFVLREGGSF